MNEEEGRLLRENALSFFGVITASLSHEINNSVAIIAELSGLLGDLLLGAEQGRSIDNGKLRELSERISKQVEKGQGIIKRLNRFAHSTDNPDRTFDLKELLEQLTALAERFAFLKGVRLETEFAEESMTIRNNPFSLQQAVFLCIELALAASGKDEVVTLTFNEERSEAKIIITGAPLAETEDVNSRLSFLTILMKELGGKMEAVAIDDGKHSLILSLPRGKE